MKKQKTNVYLRERRIASGNTQLYLEYYDREGTRRMKGIGITLAEEKTRADKRENNEKRAKAEMMRQEFERELETLAAGGHVEHLEVRFFDYCREQAIRLKKGSAHSNYESAITKARYYSKNDKITFRSITKEWVLGYKMYLLEEAGLTHNTASIYYGCMAYLIRSAFSDGIINFDPTKDVRPIVMQETDKSYLTQEELKMMLNTPTRSKYTRKAFIFSCMTGMRISDVRNLLWSDVKEEEGEWYINLRQRKTFERTGRLVRIQLNEIARQQMGERGDGHVFQHISASNINSSIAYWAKKAGIKKHVTFHTSRHTFATLTLSLTQDLYLTSKMLGHSSVTTTQVYAHILDNKRKTASDNLSELFK